MSSRARISTLLLASLAWASSVGTVAAQERGSSLKLVARSGATRSEPANDSLPPIADEAPDLTPPPPEVPAFGDDIVTKPFEPSMPAQGAPASPDLEYQRRHPEFRQPEYHGPGGDHYPAAPPGTHLQRHADRLRNYIDNRPRQLPLTNESWLNKPYGISYLVGGMWLDDPLHKVVGGNAGYTYGGRFTWDFAPKFGVEGRIGGANAGIVDRIGGTDLAPANIFYADVDWLWYFTGDTRWRPFVLIGTGLFDIDFTDAQPVRHHSMLLQLPIGFGLKYRHTSRIAMRVDLIDNIGFASGQLDTMHNWSLTAGIEARFGGGRKRNYWPWNPSREWW